MSDRITVSFCGSRKSEELRYVIGGVCTCALACPGALV